MRAALLAAIVGAAAGFVSFRALTALLGYMDAHKVGS